VTEDQIERLVLSFGKIASALEGLHEEVKKAGTRYWPERKEQREAILTRVQTEEDKIKKIQGIADESISITQWLDIGDPEGEDEGIVGERSRQWRIDHPKEKAKTSDASSKDSSVGEPDTKGAEKDQSQA
jgi:hypothetical protein